MNLRKYISTIGLFTILVCGVMAIYNGPAYPGTITVQPWEREFGFAALVPTDIYENPDTPDEAMVCPTIVEIIEIIEMNQFYSSDPRPETTTLLRGKIWEALSETLSTELLDNDILDMVYLAPAEFAGPRIGKSRLFEGQGYVFWVTFMTGNDKFIIIGALDSGLTESVLISDFSSQVEFDSLIQQYFNVPTGLISETEYRPMKINFNQYGYILPDPDCHWGYSGYAVSFTDGNTVGFTRSVDRKFVRRGDQFDTVTSSSMEFSVIYTPADNLPPLIDAGEDQTVSVNEVITFLGTTVDPEEDIVTCWWDFGDGETHQGGCNEEVTYTYLVEGFYTATFFSSDSSSATSDDTCIITVLE